MKYFIGIIKKNIFYSRLCMKKPIFWKPVKKMAVIL
jgi:hypothetical protein